MERRKIQIIAGSTYTISLPKNWIRENNLKEKDEILVDTQNDKSLILSPEKSSKKETDEISLDVKKYSDNLDRILFSIYYLGIEQITLYSKEKMTNNAKTNIRKTLSNMSGTEISYEDEKKIVIGGLLDKSKINIYQIMYRISMITDLSIQNIIEGPELKEIKLNENEIDRLYHLATKVISMSLTDYKTLSSSKIKETSFIPSYFLIFKKFESLADNLNHLAQHIKKNNIKIGETKKILEFMKKENNRIIKHVLKEFPDIFKKIPEEERKSKKNEIFEIKDKIISDYLRDILKYIIDIEDEIITCSFYKNLIREKKL